jgi:DNA-binding response OmpR family regulator
MVKVACNRFAGRRMLVVDDSPPITTLIREILEMDGARVFTVNTGSAAILQLELGTFDLVVLDLLMPDPGGWQVLRYIRSNRPGLLERIVLLTGDRYRRDTLRRIARVDLPVVYKPFDLEELRSAASTVLDRASTPVA